ncbi:MAG: hypothetical protein C0401_04885 [Anaerolinea sp.]|nr:hypothetical protein [Anaerolinea sp.]
MRRIFLVSFLAILTISPIQTRYWSSDEGELEISPFPDTNWTVLEPLSFSKMDFGIDTDCVAYENEKIEIKDCLGESHPTKWKSPDEWNVTEAILADLNRDDRNELVMVVWRAFKPWPIDKFLPHGGRINSFQDRKGMSCHLILVGWDGKKYRELWAGSSLIDPIFDIRAADLDQDDNQELVALEGQYDSTNQSGAITVWEWSGFGFRLQDRVEGKFSNYAIVSANQKVWILSE